MPALIVYYVTIAVMLAAFGALVLAARRRTQRTNDAALVDAASGGGWRTDPVRLDTLRDAISKASKPALLAFCDGNGIGADRRVPVASLRRMLTSLCTALHESGKRARSKPMPFAPSVIVANEPAN